MVTGTTNGYKIACVIAGLDYSATLIIDQNVIVEGKKYNVLEGLFVNLNTI